MKFEYDKNKSQFNKEKHGIDFVDVQNLWQDENALIVPANIIDDEVRYALISILKDKCYTAIFTLCIPPQMSRQLPLKFNSLTTLLPYVTICCKAF